MTASTIKFHFIRESLARFDGGAMFGHVPKAVWSKLAPADEFNRIECSCNAILARVGGLNILTDPGMGLKWTPKEAALYHLRARPWEELLAPHGLTPDDIHAVAMSHLHIDHAGALTRWDADGRAVPVFPNAKVYVQRLEWERANNPDSRSRPSYRPQDFVPLMESGQIVLIDGDGEFLPGVESVVTGGHTAAHQALRFADGDGGALWFLADIFPSTAHLKPHWVMGYDLYPMGVMEARARLLPELAKQGVRCALGHDPFQEIGRIVEVDGKYEWVGE